MYKNVLQSIEGIDMYPIISLLIFCAFFVSLGVWIVRVKKGYLQEMSALPLDQGQATQYTHTHDDDREVK